MLDSRVSTSSDIPITTGASHSPTVRTHPALEASRLSAVRELAADFNASCGAALGGRKWFSHFETWLWAARTAAGASAPVLPAQSAYNANAELEQKLVRAGMSAEEASRAVSRLASRATQLAQRSDTVCVYIPSCAKSRAPSGSRRGA